MRRREPEFEAKIPSSRCPWGLPRGKNGDGVKRGRGRVKLLSGWKSVEME